MANTTSTKISISDAHWKLGHIAHSAIQHAVSKRFIIGIEIDSESKPDFCEACAKAKLACQPFPKESNRRGQNTNSLYTTHPPQNGVAERGMRTHAERAHALLLSSSLPRFLWKEAMNHSMWLQNGTPAHATNGKTL